MIHDRSVYQYSRKEERGFSILEVFIVVLILAIVTTFAVMGITRSRSSFQFSNAAETLKSYLEKAVSDAKRRHAQGGTRAKIQVLSTSTYQVTIDFNGDGTAETRTVTLPAPVVFVYTAGSPPQATIDWRGNVAEGDVTFNLQSDLNQTAAIGLTKRGDTSIDSQFSAFPTVSATPVSSDVKSSAILVGNSSPNLDISPTPTPTPLPYCTGTQKPAVNSCRCQTGKTIDSTGKCV